MENIVRFASGKQAGYDAIIEKDPHTLYFVTDTHRIYLGDELFGSGLIENLEQQEEIEIYGGSATELVGE